MRKPCTRWWMILGCWSCAACAAWAQPADRAPPPPLEPLPAEGLADSGLPSSPACSPACSPGDSRPQSAIRAWWEYRAKPALQYSHWGYADEFEEIPFGARVQAAQRAQICSGWAARVWLYRYDFCDEGAGLNAAGDKRLRELAGEFPVWAQHALVIESTGNQQLDAARHTHVAKLLENSGIPARVVIGVPTVAAPFGDETGWWYSRFERQVRSGGPVVGGQRHF